MNSFLCFLYQGDLGELPFPCPDGFSSCPDICFRVADSSFLCHKVPVLLLSTRLKSWPIFLWADSSLVLSELPFLRLSSVGAVTTSGLFWMTTFERVRSL